MAKCWGSGAFSEDEPRCRSTIVDSPVCGKCFNRVAGSVESLPYLYERLETQSRVPLQRAGSGDWVTGSKASSLPGGAWASLASEIVGLVVVTEDYLRACLGWTQATRREQPNYQPSWAVLLTRGCRTIQTSLRQLLEHDVEKGVALVRLAAKARRLLDDGPGTNQVPGPCPECGVWDGMIRFPPDPKLTTLDVQCQVCGMWADLMWLVQVLAVDYPDMRLPTTRCADLVGVSPATIRSWVGRSKLVAVGANEVGHPTYRVGDVMALKNNRKKL